MIIPVKTGRNSKGSGFVTRKVFGGREKFLEDGTVIGTVACSRASTQEYCATPLLARLGEVVIRKAEMMIECVALIAIGFILAAGGACLRCSPSTMTTIVE